MHADVLGDDLFILEALRRIGPLTVSIDSGSFSIDIDVSRQPCQPSEIRIPVGFETATGGDRRLVSTWLQSSLGAWVLPGDHDSLQSQRRRKANPS